MGSNKAVRVRRQGEMIADTVKVPRYGTHCAIASRPDEHRLDKVAPRSYLRFMRSVGLKTLKNKVSEYVRLAAGGRDDLISDRDRVVAELIPPRDTRTLPVRRGSCPGDPRRCSHPPAPSRCAPTERVAVAPLDDILGGLGGAGPSVDLRRHFGPPGGAACRGAASASMPC